MTVFAICKSKTSTVYIGIQDNNENDIISLYQSVPDDFTEIDLRNVYTYSKPDTDFIYTTTISGLTLASVIYPSHAPKTEKGKLVIKFEGNTYTIDNAVQFGNSCVEEIKKSEFQPKQRMRRLQKH